MLLFLVLPFYIWWEDIIFKQSLFSVLILLQLCNLRDVSEERERSHCHMGGRQGHVPARVHSLQPYLSCRWCLQRPVLVTVLSPSTA